MTYLWRIAKPSNQISNGKAAAGVKDTRKDP